jgi:hypothetical protein
MLTDHWHDAIADPNMVITVLDCLIHNAHGLALKGDSMRKITAQRGSLTPPRKPDSSHHAGKDSRPPSSKQVAAFNQNP